MTQGRINHLNRMGYNQKTQHSSNVSLPKVWWAVTMDRVQIIILRTNIRLRTTKWTTISIKWKAPLAHVIRARTWPNLISKNSKDSVKRFATIDWKNSFHLKVALGSNRSVRMRLCKRIINSLRSSKTTLKQWQKVWSSDWITKKVIQSNRL